MYWGLAFLLVFVPLAVAADTVVASRTVRPHEILSAADLSLVEKTVPGALQTLEEALGQETRVVLYAGRPVLPQDVGPPAIIERNQIVTLIYRSGALTIAAEARAMMRGGVGDFIRVMNIASRTTVSGVVREDGTVMVGSPIVAN